MDIIELFKKTDATINKMSERGEVIPKEMLEDYARLKKVVFKMLMEEADDEKVDLEQGSDMLKMEISKREPSYYKNIGTGDFSVIKSEEDFYDNALYEYIYNGMYLENKENLFLPSGKIKSTEALLEKLAKEKGGTVLVRHFRKFCSDNRARVKKEYELKLAAEERDKLKKNQETENTTQYTNLPSYSTGNKYIDSRFEATDNGIFEFRERNGFTMRVPIVEWPVLMNRIIVPDSAKKGEVIEKRIELLFRDTDGWHRGIYPFDTLVDSAKVSELMKTGIGFEKENAKSLASALLSMYNKSCKAGVLPKLSCMNTLGWNDDKTKFCPYVNENELILDVGTGFRNIAESLKPCGDEQKWYEMMCYMRKTGGLMVKFAIAAVLAAPIVGFCDLEGFVCNIYGNSRTGKSLSNKAAITIFGSNDPKKGLVSSFNATASGMEFKLSFLNNLPAVLEDYNNQQRKDGTQALVMSIANGVGRIRGDKDSTNRELKTYNLAVLTNSEQKIGTTFTTNGAVNRLMECCAPDTCPWTKENASNIHHFFMYNYGFAGPKYIQILLELGQEEIRRRITEVSKQIEITEAEMKRSIGNQEACAAVLMVADRIAGELLFKDKEYMTTKEIISCMADENDSDQYRRFYQSLVDIVYTHAANFEDMANQALISPGGLWGKYESKISERTSDGRPVKSVGILPEKLRELAKEYDVDLTLFYDYLRKNDLLIADKGTNTTKMRIKYLNNARVRVVRIILPDERDEDEGNKLQRAEDEKEKLSISEEEIPFSYNTTNDIEEEYMEYNRNEDPFADVD